jgi:hypothetical protein
VKHLGMVASGIIPNLSVISSKVENGDKTATKNPKQQKRA